MADASNPKIQWTILMFTLIHLFTLSEVTGALFMKLNKEIQRDI